MFQLKAYTFFTNERFILMTDFTPHYKKSRDFLSVLKCKKGNRNPY